MVDVHLNYHNWFHFLILEEGLLVIVVDCMVFSATVPRCYKDLCVNSFFLAQLGMLSYRMPVECFSLICDLNGFKSRINRHLLTVGSL